MAHEPAGGFPHHLTFRDSLQGVRGIAAGETTESKLQIRRLGTQIWQLAANCILTSKPVS
jgi:hypothetical protein